MEVKQVLRQALSGLQQRVNLNDEQTEKIKSILLKQFSKYDDIDKNSKLNRDEAKKLNKRLIKDAKEDIEKILEESQIELFEKYNSR